MSEETMVEPEWDGGPPNPHETDEERAKRVEAFRGWASRGFVRCAA